MGDQRNGFFNRTCFDFPTPDAARVHSGEGDNEFFPGGARNAATRRGYRNDHKIDALVLEIKELLEHRCGQGGSCVITRNMTISEVNAMEKEDFLQKFGGVYECSRWAAEAIVDKRPFENFEDLVILAKSAVDAASGETKMELVRAHPDLAGKIALEDLTEESRQEQTGAGLDRLDEKEFDLFTGLNEAYRGIFGFPFIICVGNTDKSGILRAFSQRLLNGSEEEFQTALSEIHQIARLRIEAIAASRSQL